MFEQSAPKDWSRAFPPAEDESPSDSAEPAAGPAKSPLPPMPIGGPAAVTPEARSYTHLTLPTNRKGEDMEGAADTKKKKTRMCRIAYYLHV